MKSKLTIFWTLEFRENDSSEDCQVLIDLTEKSSKWSFLFRYICKLTEKFVQELHYFAKNWFHEKNHHFLLITLLIDLTEVYNCSKMVSRKICQFSFVLGLAQCDSSWIFLSRFLRNFWNFSVKSMQFKFSLLKLGKMAYRKMQIFNISRKNAKE